jgi:zinc protease
MKLSKLIALFVSSGLFVLPGTASAIEVAFERDASIPLVYLNVAVKTGTVTDPQGAAGLTNFTGEVMIRGTRSRSKEQIDVAIDQLGAQLSVETRAEALIFRGAVLATQLDRFLDLLKDIITQPSFPDTEIRKLKSEVVSGILEELATDSTLTGRRFAEFMFAGHPYGKPVLGKVKDIESLNRQKVAAHYEYLFNDANLLVVGAGDAEQGKIDSWARMIGENRKASGQEIAKVAPPQLPAARRLLIIDKPDRTQTQIRAGQVGVRMTDKEFFPLYLGNHAFGGGSFSARLMVEIRVKRGWSYGAYSYFRHGQRPRSWEFQLAPASKDAAPALERALAMASELREKGISAEEYEFAKQSLVNSAGFMFNTPEKRVENKLLERTLELPDGFMKTYGPELSKVKLEEVNQAFRKFLAPERLSIAVLATAKDLKAPLTKAAGVQDSQVQVVPYTQE